MTLCKSNKLLIVVIVVLGDIPANTCLAQSVTDSTIKITNIESSYPFWSPDGSRLAFHSNRNGNADIYVMKADGSSLIQLTMDPAEDYTPAWSPDGTKITFQSDRDGNREIYIMNTDGSEQTNLTNHPAEDSHPKWSPDGTRIIFDSDRTELEENYELYEMNADGSGLQRLTNYGEWDTYASLSPDGSTILWRRITEEAPQASSGRNSEIFVMSRDSYEPVNLTNHPAYDGWPAWSPDGSQIAFASDREEPRVWHIYIMKHDGFHVTRLTPDDPGARYTRPIWSPDGSKIACNRSKDGNVDIMVILLTRQRKVGVRFSRVETGRIVSDFGQSRGLAWGDFDNDGYADLYVTNSGGQWNFLYRNNGEGSFTKMRGAEVVRHRGFSEGVNWVDFDNDGDLDLFVANTEDWEAGAGDDANFLFRNDADNGFVQVTEGPLVSDRTNAVTACWADYDNDGLLDVFVVNRGDQNDAFYRNLGAGDFERIQTGSLVNNGGDGRTCACGDMDGDGNLDLYVGNFRQRNFFYLNDGGDSFTEVTQGDFVINVALTYGVSFVDYDYDGDLDLFVTNIGRNDRNLLYQNNGRGNLTPLFDNPMFEHIKYSDSGGGASKGHTWGDFDNDGDLDLYVANGTYQADMRNFLYMQEGNGRFALVTEGPIVADADTSAGVAWADYDNDGDLDLFVANWGSDDQDNTLYRNETTGRTWFSMRLEGRRSNRFGIGTRVRLKVTIDGKAVWQIRHMLPNTGYASQNSLDIHFGLGDATRIDSLQVYWPSGTLDQYTNIKPNSFWIAVEGEALKPNERKGQ